MLELVNDRNKVITNVKPTTKNPNDCYYKAVIEFTIGRFNHKGGYYYYKCLGRKFTWDTHDKAVAEAERFVHNMFDDQVTNFYSKGGSFRRSDEFWPDLFKQGG